MPDIAIIGDVHLQFVEEDVEYFNASLYDLLIFVGDLAGYLASRTRDVAHLISQLEQPTLFIPGNHDWFDNLDTFQELIIHRSWLGGWYYFNLLNYIKYL